MSLFDLQDVCIAIGSLATLDLPMVVDLIGIYALKGPYCTLTTTDWFLQELVSMTFRVVRTNQYNQDLGLIHSTIGNHLERPNEGSSIDHQVTTNLHAQNITMFPTNETWYFTSQMLVSSSDVLILILTAKSVGDNGGSGYRFSGEQRKFKSFAPRSAAVDRQSGPRSEARILRQPALEGLKNSTRTESPLHGDRSKSGGARRRRVADGGGA
ncbi:hypothetical protein F511_08695 [Dorcoceras hygrometricum]|uniref:Uncharacterized protein n=1 Tax=Dorcoceras hygrometricum TaxID=472368 RepID=A0A2Z7CGU0_9LAMI|nr:hypothetical protein F511_08695 [Dorcoceras hygrometricum]